MIVEWKNIEAFKQHAREMEAFRRAHAHLTPAARMKITRAAAVPYGNSSSPPLDPLRNFIDISSKVIVVPIWELSMPQGSEN